MAAVTGADNIAVIKTSTTPGIGSMAIIAKVAADNMLRVLTGRPTLVMAKVTFKRCALELARQVTT